MPQLRQHRSGQDECGPPHLRLHRHPVLEPGPYPGDQGQSPSPVKSAIIKTTGSQVMKTTYCPLFRNPGDGGTCPLRPLVIVIPQFHLLGILYKIYITSIYRIYADDLGNLSRYVSAAKLLALCKYPCRDITHLTGFVHR